MKKYQEWKRDYPEFQPNLTPREIFTRGSFGGGYWRPINSGVLKKNYLIVTITKILLAHYYEGYP